MSEIDTSTQNAVRLARRLRQEQTPKLLQTFTQTDIDAADVLEQLAAQRDAAVERAERWEGHWKNANRGMKDYRERAQQLQREQDAAIERAERAEADAQHLAEQDCYLCDLQTLDLRDRTATYYHIHSHFKEWQKQLAKARRDVERLRDALANYGEHESLCIRARWNGGRPTEDGGYETRFGTKWYKRGEEPDCTCGLDAAMQEGQGDDS